MYIVLNQGFQGSAPEWFLLFPRGEVRIKGEPPAIMDDEAAALVMAAFDAGDHDMVIDYEHQTLAGGEAPAAGWITDLDWREDGLWARARWTDKAGGYISRGEYRYFSPVMLIDKLTRRIVRLKHFALTNAPGLDTIQALAAKEYFNLNEEGNIMWEKILKMLGLASDAGEDQAVAALKGVLEKVEAQDKELKTLKEAQGKASDTDVVACKEVLEALGLTADADKDKAVAAVTVLKEPARASGDLARRVTELQAQLDGIQGANLVDLALKEGKTSKAEVDAWGAKMAKDNPDMFKTVVLSREAGSVVPLGEVKVLKDKPGGPDKADDVQLSVNKQLGISAETWSKHGPKAEGGDA